MKTLKSLLIEEVRVTNLDTDEELDLDALADIDLEALLADDGFGDEIDSEYQPLDFSDGSIEGDDLDFELTGDESELDVDLDAEGDSDFDFSVDDDFDDELGDDFSEDDLDALSVDSEEAEEVIGDDPTGEASDQDFQGEIRTVRGANLVYKRKTEDGNFEELWVYNVGNDIKRETQIRRAILAGTDIDPGSQESKDGSQRSDTSTIGNVQFLYIDGLPQ